MINLGIGILELVVVFSLVIIIEKIFKKEGLYVWVSIAVIIANLIVAKTIDIVNISTSIGNVIFASTFLATDILSEKYAKEDAKKAIYLSVFANIAFVITTQISLAFIPNENDILNESMKNIFSLNIRTTIASITMFFISNMLDIYIYNKLKKKNNKKMWLRNNVATIISNCLENYLFFGAAFIGIFPLKTVLIIASTKTVLEIIIALFDTPFLYISTKLLKSKEEKAINEN